MIKVYFKQAWMLMKQNRLFSGIYILGTGLSIAMVMAVFIIMYVKFAPIYPEYNRDRMLLINNANFRPMGDTTQLHGSRGISVRAFKLLKEASHLDKITGYTAISWASLIHKNTLFPVSVCQTDGAYWRVFDMEFLTGRPYTDADMDGAVKVAVLNESFARKYFASVDVVGQNIELSTGLHKIVGVVRNVSYATPLTAFDVWTPRSDKVAPINVVSIGDRRMFPCWLSGDIKVCMLSHTSGECEALKEEVKGIFRKLDQEDEHWKYIMGDLIIPYWQSVFSQDWDEFLKEVGVLLLALLLIPAVNLSGMIGSAMNKRLCELGVRKTYGASRGELFGQVICENLVLSLLGGVCGLVLSYLIVATSGDWILSIFDSGEIETGKDTCITMEMLFNPWVFTFTFLFCVLLNLISTLIPTVLSLRKPIVQSLNTNRN